MGMDGEQPTITVDCSLGIHHPKRRQTKTPALNLPPEIIQLEGRYSVIESSAFSVKFDRHWNKRMCHKDNLDRCRTTC